MFAIGQRVIFNPGGSKWPGYLRDGIGTIVANALRPNSYVVMLDEAPECDAGLSGYDPAARTFRSSGDYLVSYDDSPAVQIKTLEAFI